MPTPIRRFFLWSAAAWVSAAPSFVLGSHVYHPGAMALGVLLYTLFLTAISCTLWFERMHRRPHVRETLYIGYGTRMLISIVFPVAIFFDVMTGQISVALGNQIFNNERDFVATLFVTLVQGTFINFIVLLFMIIVHSMMVAFRAAPNQRVDFSKCGNCEYDLRGSRKSERCPECGTNVPWLASGG